MLTLSEMSSSPIKTTNRIQAWTAGATFGNTIASSFGVGSDQLVSPVDVFPDNYGNLYVTDYTKHRIEKWTFPNTGGVIVAGGNGLGMRLTSSTIP